MQGDLLLWIEFFLHQQLLIFKLHLIGGFLLSRTLFGRGGASTLLLLFPDALPNMLKVTMAEGSDITILSVPASAAADLLDHVFV